ncbi:hypothetical protein V1523DRAFT_132395 [Lipomyces doorenjongii]
MSAPFSRRVCLQPLHFTLITLRSLSLVFMTSMDQSEVVIAHSHYCRRCSSCRTWTRCETIEELQQVFSGLDGRPVKSCQKCRANVSLSIYGPSECQQRY